MSTYTANKTLHIEDFIEPDHRATSIARRYVLWETMRTPMKNRWKEVHEYVFATDTGDITSINLPWSNKTVIPKLCQIRDNLYANYMATLFPNSRWLTWEGDTEEDDTIQKKDFIESYMQWVTDREKFYSTVGQAVNDLLDTGNLFLMPDFIDQTSVLSDTGADKVGYVGPIARRISPYDIVFNPTAPSFEETAKIVRSFVSLGDLKDMLTNEATTDEEKEEAQELWNYLAEYRASVNDEGATVSYKDSIFDMAGLGTWKEYLNCGYAEVLTFYGDLYDEETQEFHKNVVVKIVDRHKLISMKTNPSYFGTAPIFHVGWRKRPDSLWAMGPLENLVGLQYRLDHLENLKADLVDLTALPPLKVKGWVPDFEWGPMERIYVGDEGDIELMSPDVNALQLDNQIQLIMAMMEEIAGAPREAMGFRSPGEKTKYEVQVLENGASRIFQSKTAQIERDGIEPLLNGMLEVARRKIKQSTIRTFDQEFGNTVFITLTPEDITGAGRIRPMAARHFAERANLLQNLTQFYSSAIGQDQGVLVHFSGEKTARMLENILDIKQYDLITPYVRISEQAEQQRQLNAVQEQVMVEAQTRSGLTPADIETEEQTNELEITNEETQ